ncbi:MAG: DoxX family protein [Flavobacteriaceae bacterium]|nr:DoxX family protein [Flavobacteriaceae bacterium]
MESLFSHSAEILLLLFLLITFLQSALDKIFDWKGNFGFLKDHFSKSPFRNMVPALLGVITILELVTGIVCFSGILQILNGGETTLAYVGGILACTSLLFLLLGQRIAKDYEGAKTIVIYFIPAVLLVYLLQV